MTAPRRRVALLGGSFHPPHLGHLLAAVTVRAVTGVDAVWLVPVDHHAFGKDLAPFELRAELCRALVRGFDGLSVCEAERGGSGRTLDLLDRLRVQHPDVDWTLVMGTDLLTQAHRWHRWSEVVSSGVEILVLERGGHPFNPLAPCLEGARWTLLDSVLLPEISSTELRRALAGGLDGPRVRQWMPAPVRAICARRGLYASHDPSPNPVSTP